MTRSKQASFRLWSVHFLATVKCIYLLDCSLRLPWQHLVCSVKFPLSYGRSYASQSLGRRIFFFFVKMIRNLICYFGCHLSEHSKVCTQDPTPASVWVAAASAAVLALPNFLIFLKKKSPQPPSHTQLDPVPSPSLWIALCLGVSLFMLIPLIQTDQVQIPAPCLPLRAGHIASFLSQIDGSVSLEEFGHAFSRYVHRCIVGIHEMAPGKAAGVVPSF